MVDEVKYTIAMCNLNNYPVIEQSISSIAEQVDDRFEILVIDDGSTDGSLEILHQLKNEYNQLRVIKGDNDNLAEARNHSLQESRGEYILESMDPDDRYRDGIQDFVYIFEQINCRIDEDIYLKGNSINLAPARLLQKYPYRSLGYGEDRDLWRRLFSNDKIIWLDHLSFCETLRDEYSFKEHIRNVFEINVVDFRSGITLWSHINYSVMNIRRNTKSNMFRLLISLPAYVVALRRGFYDPPANDLHKKGMLENYIDEKSRTLRQIERQYDFEIDQEQLSDEGQRIFYHDITS